MRVALLGRGPSVREYVDRAKLGGRGALYDEVWAVNAMGDVVACDRVFHMDDVRIQERRAAANPGGDVAAMLQWLKRHRGPVYTSRPHPDYPCLVEYPLQEVLREFGFAYFNSTVAYAVAYAIWLGSVKVLAPFGLDFTLRDAHAAERGRACVEFWLGIASQRGIRIAAPSTTSLMDACEPDAGRFYGYDTLDVKVSYHGSRATGAALVERAEWPTAEEMERRYDHSRHPGARLRAANG